MELPNLILKFRYAEEAEMQVTAASRITIDGRGLVLHSADQGHSRRVIVSRLQALSIKGIHHALRPARMASAA